MDRQLATAAGDPSRHVLTTGLSVAAGTAAGCAADDRL